MTLFALNFSPRPRMQVVRFRVGDPNQVDPRWQDCGNGLASARVVVPPRFMGPVEVVDPPEGPWLSPSMEARVPSLRFVLNEGAEGKTEFKFVGEEQHSEIYSVWRWEAVGKNGVGVLWTELGRGEDRLRVTFGFFAQLLDVPSKTLTAMLEVECKRPVFLRPRHESMGIVDRKMYDACGIMRRGVLFAIDNEYSDTDLAEFEHDWMVMDGSLADHWGLFGRKAKGWHPGRKGWDSLTSPFTHSGYIMAPQVEDPDGSLGLFKALDVLGDKRVDLLLYDVYACSKLANRPAHWLEPNGGLVELSSHPQLRLWSGYPQRPHWPDGLGRKHGHEDRSVWTNMDWEHWGGVPEAATAYITGDPGLRYLCLHQARNMHATRSLPFQGRGLGRTIGTGLWLLDVTGYKPLQDMLDAWVPQFVGDMEARNLRDGQIAYANRIVIDDRAVPGSEAWIPWEDGIALEAIGALLRRYPNDAGLKDVAWKMGRSLVLYGIEVVDGSPVAYKYREWNNGKLGGKDELAWGTDYASWVLSGVAVARDLAREHNEPGVIDKANDFIQAVQAGGYIDRFSYFGAL